MNIKPLFFIVICVLIFGVGCIRLQGKAFYTKKNPETQQIETKDVGFDTQDYVPGAPSGSITVVE